MPTVITKTIGQDGWQDYSTFAAAEAAVATIAGGSDLVSLDVAVVFEAYSGDYGVLLVNGPLTTDATRNVTYTAAENSKHGGVPGAGVVIKQETSASFAVAVQDSYTKIQDIEIKRFGTSDGRSCAFVTGDPSVVTFENVIINNDGDDGVRGHGIAFNGQSADYNGTLYVNNCLYVNNIKYCVQYNLLTVSAGPNVYADNNTVLDCDRFVGVDNNSVNQLGTISLNNNVVGNINGGSPATLYHTHYTDPLSPRSIGTGNIGVAESTRFDSSALVGSQAWTFTSATDSASTGSQLIYDPTTYKLVNVSGNDAIGVGTASEAPTTTDIAGNDRLRGASDEYVDPGAFTCDKVTYTKTIGSGRDYTTFTAAEGAVTTIPYDTNLAERNLAIVFEADSGTYSEVITINSSLTTDATRNVTYRPASGAEHGGDKAQGVRILGTNNIVIQDAHTAVEGFVWSSAYRVRAYGNSVVCRNLLLDFSPGSGFFEFNVASTLADEIRVENCVFFSGTNAMLIRDATSGLYLSLANCTFLPNSYAVRTAGSHFSTVNSLVIDSGFIGFGTAASVSGSNNIGGATNSFPSAIQAEGQTWTFTTDTSAASTGSQVVYASATGAMLNVTGNDAVGVGVGSATVVPTTDILGNPRIRGGRDEYADPGAFTTDKVTATKTIDLNGNGDYTTFNAAEGAIVTVANALLGGSRTNLPQRNGEIVYEAVKGTYEFTSWWDINDNFAVPKGPENRVIYRPKAGSEHGGIPLEGVVLGWTVNGSLHNYEPFSQIEGLNLSAYPNGQFIRGRVGGEYWKDNIMIATPEDRTVWSSEGLGPGDAQYRKDTSASPRTMENNLFIGRMNLGTNVNCPPNNILANNTIKYEIAHGNINKHLNVSAYNNLSLNSNKVYGAYYGITHFEGSGNVGFSGTAYPWPSNAAGFKGDIVPVNDNSDIPASGDYILYHPTKYRLIDSPRNAAINEGVGTDAGTFIPSTDIQGVTRGSTSSNPGAYQLLIAVPVFQDVSLQTQNDDETISGFFRNPFAPGPSVADAFVTLPDDTVPVFIVIGDSTGNGFVSADGHTLDQIQEGVAARGANWPDNAYDGSAFGYFWDKYMSTSDSGVTWQKGVDALIGTTTSGSQFEPLHPRIGGPNLIGNFTYNESDAGKSFAQSMFDLGVGQAGANVPPVWDFAVANRGLFRKANGDFIAPYFIFAVFNSQRLGTPGTPYGSFGTLDYYCKTTDEGEENVGGTFEQLRTRYIRPAINYIVNTLGKNPVLAGELFMLGASEANVNYPEAYTLSASSSYLDHINSIKALINTTKDYPVVMYEAYPGDDSVYPVSRTRLLAQAVRRLFFDGHRTKVILADLPRTSAGDPNHFSWTSYKQYGERFAAAYRNLLTARVDPAVAPTMGNITF